MPSTKVNGIDIVYEDVGSGTPIIFIHGAPFNRSMWTPQVEALRDLRAITFDLRGYGESGMSVDDFTFDLFARDIGGLMDALSIESAVIVGLSMGGQIAMETWVQFPERVRALVLADTFAQLDAPVRKQLRYDTAAQLLAKGMDRYADETLSKMISPRSVANKPDVAQHVLTMMRTTPPKGAAAALRARAERRDYVPVLGTISVPTLIVVGEDDEFTPVSDAEFMQELIPESQMVVITDCGHMPNLEQPEAFNQVFLGFLKTLD